MKDDWECDNPRCKFAAYSKKHGTLSMDGQILDYYKKEFDMTVYGNLKKNKRR